MSISGNCNFYFGGCYFYPPPSQEKSAFKKIPLSQKSKLKGLTYPHSLPQVPLEAVSFIYCRHAVGLVNPAKFNKIKFKGGRVVGRNTGYLTRIELKRR